MQRVDDLFLLAVSEACADPPKHEKISTYRSEHTQEKADHSLEEEGSKIILLPADGDLLT